MKKWICFMLCMLLLCGCGAQSAGETGAPVPAPQAYPFADSLITTERYAEPEDPEARLAWRRALVEERMRQMTAMYWKSTADIEYVFEDVAVTLKAGNIYRGMPYTHGSGSGLSFLTFATGRDDQGVYTVSELDGARMTTVPHISNDCSDALFWAWGAVSGSIGFTLTKNMTAMNGCIPVGDYQVNVTKYDGGTAAIIQENGENVMLESYALLQKGDGMVRYGKAGHAVMVTETAVVRNADGSVNADESYVIILEQTSGNIREGKTYFDEALGCDVHVFGGVDEKWTFRHLLEKAYLPVTCRELIDPTPLAEERVEDTLQEYGEKEILSGALKSNYRISHVMVRIFDEHGAEVQRDTGFASEKTMYNYKLSGLRGGITQLSRGDLKLDELAPGTYRCVLTCTLSTGRTVTVRDFTFTK